MKRLDEIANTKKLEILNLGIDGGSCNIRFGRNRKAFIVFSNGGGWDHVSISMPKCTPTWEEMCIIKDLFFNEDECVMQVHPKKADYVNIHNYCLHLWKPQHKEIPMPHINFV